MSQEEMIAEEQAGPPYRQEIYDSEEDDRFGRIQEGMYTDDEEEGLSGFCWEDEWGVVTEAFVVFKSHDMVREHALRPFIWMSVLRQEFLPSKSHFMVRENALRLFIS